MKRATLAILLALTFFVPVIPTFGSFQRDIYASVGKLEAQHPDTQEWTPVCTATIIDKQGSQYTIVSAAHCVELTAGQEGKYRFELEYGDRHDQLGPYDLKLVALGSLEKGEDYSLFTFETEEKHSHLKLGDVSKLEPGDPVEYAGWPGMFGTQLFEGRIARKPGALGDVSVPQER